MNELDLNNKNENNAKTDVKPESVSVKKTSFKKTTKKTTQQKRTTQKETKSKTSKKSTAKKSSKNTSKNTDDNVSRITLINCSKSIKMSLPDYGSLGITYSVSMDIGKEDSTQERVDARKDELSNLVERYLSDEIIRVFEFYKMKRQELEKEIFEYSKKLAELNDLKSQFQFLSNVATNEHLNNEGMTD